MSRIVLRGHIIVTASDLPAVQSELPGHIELTRQEEGCIAFQVSQDRKNENVFDVYEEFVDREAFELHQARVKSSPWGQVSKKAERHYTIIEGD